MCAITVRLLCSSRSRSAAGWCRRTAARSIRSARSTPSTARSASRWRVCSSTSAFPGHADERPKRSSPSPSERWLSMKILIVGGTGMIGVHAALHLREHGDDVTVAGRGPISAESPVAEFPLLLGDYTVPTFTPAQLEHFDGIVFAAGQDVRHKTPEDDTPHFWETTQSVGVPRFAALAEQAGVPRFVQVGSYYHQLRPDLAERNPYIAARKAADEGVRALAGD